MLTIILIAGTSISFSIILGYYLTKIKVPKQLIDHPNPRKIHYEPTPQVGGILVYLTLLFCSILFLLIDDSIILFYLGFCLIFLLIGILDDFIDLSYKSKIFLQLIGILAFIHIIKIDYSIITFSTISIQSPLLNIFLLSLWMIGIINSYNFFDGANTLAGSIAIIIFASYGFLLYNQQSLTIILIYVVVIFSLMGFLKYNRTPAKMFLGDSGSHLIGFLIISLPFIMLNGTSEGLNITIPVIMTSILALETIFLIFNRIRNKKSPFSPDKSHLHHHFLSITMRNRYVVLIISGSVVLLSILSYFSPKLNFFEILFFELLFLFVVIILPRKLDHKTVKKVRLDK